MSSDIATVTDAEPVEKSKGGLPPRGASHQLAFVESVVRIRTEYHLILLDLGSQPRRILLGWVAGFILFLIFIIALGARASAQNPAEILTYVFFAFVAVAMVTWATRRYLDGRRRIRAVVDPMLQTAVMAYMKDQAAHIKTMERRRQHGGTATNTADLGAKLHVAPHSNQHVSFDLLRDVKQGSSVLGEADADLALATLDRAIADKVTELSHQNIPMDNIVLDEHHGYTKGPTLFGANVSVYLRWSLYGAAAAASV